MYFEFV